MTISKKHKELTETRIGGIVKPMVDDQFWFEMSREMVISAVNKRDKAAGKLQKMIVWFWGIYTTSVFIGISMLQKSYSPGIIIIISSPSVLLIAAYWFAVWAQMPIEAKFDRRIPKDIQEAYFRGVVKKRFRLNTALALSLVSAILLLSSIYAVSVSIKSTSTHVQSKQQLEEFPEKIIE